jgi:broad specificity phosphatase PhoE
VDVILIRHGVTDWNEQGRLMGRSDVELNARGRQQVAAVAEVLREVPIAAVLSSPQRRAQQTAEAIAGLHGLAVGIEDALAEVWLGRWQGLTWEDLRSDPDVARYLADPLSVCDIVEPATAVLERVVNLVERLRAGSGDTLVLVSHGDPLRILLAHYLTMPFGSYRRLDVAPASVSLLRFAAASAVQVALLNWRPHRDGKQLAPTKRLAPPQIT